MANVDADLLKQAVINVIQNGAQAMPEGGRLRVTLEDDKKNAVLRIADEGTGIPDEIRDKIFDLYFTTKTEGSGIGLAMTYRILQLHHGSVEVQSNLRPWHGIRLADSTRRHGMGTPASPAGDDGKLGRNLLHENALQERCMAVAICLGGLRSQNQQAQNQPLAPPIVDTPLPAPHPAPSSELPPPVVTVPQQTPSATPATTPPPATEQKPAKHPAHHAGHQPPSRLPTPRRAQP